MTNFYLPSPLLPSPPSHVTPTTNNHLRRSLPITAGAKKKLKQFFCRVRAGNHITYSTSFSFSFGKMEEDGGENFPGRSHSQVLGQSCASIWKRRSRRNCRRRRRFSYCTVVVVIVRTHHTADSLIIPNFNPEKKRR